MRASGVLPSLAAWLAFISTTAAAPSLIPDALAAVTTTLPVWNWFFALPAALHPFMRGPRLALIDGYVLDMPERALSMLDSLPDVESAHEDRPVWATDVLSAETVGAIEVQRSGHQPQQSSGQFGHGAVVGFPRSPQFGHVVGPQVG